MLVGIVGSGRAVRTYSEAQEGDEGDGVRAETPVERSWVRVFHGLRIG
jgi:hypothetical protein